jgi:hypothetical protein
MPHDDIPLPGSTPRDPEVRPRPRGFAALPVLQVLGTSAAIVLIWLGYCRWILPGLLPWTEALVAAVLVALTAGLFAWTWIRVGGYAAYWSLWRWVHGGPPPVGVPTWRRVRYLKPLADMGSGAAWLWIALAALWAALGIADLLLSGSAALAHLTMAAVWAVLGTWRLVFVRRWGRRAVQLYHESVAEQAQEAAGPDDAPPGQPSPRVP